jgi:hypothetical protein
MLRPGAPRRPPLHMSQTQSWAGPCCRCCCCSPPPPLPPPQAGGPGRASYSSLSRWPPTKMLLRASVSIRACWVCTYRRRSRGCCRPCACHMPQAPSELAAQVTRALEAAGPCASREAAAAGLAPVQALRIYAFPAWTEPASCAHMRSRLRRATHHGVVRRFENQPRHAARRARRAVSDHSDGLDATKPLERCGGTCVCMCVCGGGVQCVYARPCVWHVCVCV